MFLLAYMRQMIFIVSFFAFSSGQSKKDDFMPLLPCRWKVKGRKFDFLRAKVL